MRLCNNFSLPSHSVHVLSSGDKQSSGLGPRQKETVTLMVCLQFHSSILQPCYSIFFADLPYSSAFSSLPPHFITAFLVLTPHPFVFLHTLPPPFVYQYLAITLWIPHFSSPFGVRGEKVIRGKL